MYAHIFGADCRIFEQTYVRIAVALTLSFKMHMDHRSYTREFLAVIQRHITDVPK